MDMFFSSQIDCNGLFQLQTSDLKLSASEKGHQRTSSFLECVRRMNHGYGGRTNMTRTHHDLESAGPAACRALSYFHVRARGTRNFALLCE